MVLLKYWAITHCNYNGFVTIALRKVYFQRRAFMNLFHLATPARRCIYVGRRGLDHTLIDEGFYLGKNSPYFGPALRGANPLLYPFRKSTTPQAPPHDP